MPPPPYIQNLINDDIKLNLDRLADSKTEVKIQRMCLEITTGDHNSDMNEFLTGTINKYMDEYGFSENGSTYQFIRKSCYDKVLPVLGGGYKRRVRKSKRANKRTHKKQRTNRRKGRK
jgi:hypothetical protein